MTACAKNVEGVMGNKYEVAYWDPDEQKEISVWSGEDFFEAVDEMNNLRANGKRCIYLVWRP